MAPPRVRPIGVCVTCRRERPIVARGRCVACAQYLRRHGVERPPEGFWEGRPTCRNCGCPTPPRKRARGRCLACYQYWYRHHVERPLVRAPRLCGHCGRPTGHLAKGRCSPCEHYWRLHGVERPTRFITRHCRECERPGPGLRRGLCPVCYQRWYRRQQAARRPALRGV